MDSVKPVVGLPGGPTPVINASLAGAAALEAYVSIGAIDYAQGQTAGPERTRVPQRVPQCR